MARDLARVLGLLLVWLGNVHATWHVTADPNDPIDGIGRVVAQTGDGDSVLIGPGTYYEHIPLPGHSLTLIGTEGAQATILDGSVPIEGRQGSILYYFAQQGPTTTMRGLTFTHGAGSQRHIETVGGAIAYESLPGEAILDIRTCAFRENDLSGNTLSNGGAIWVNCADLTLGTCEFEGNGAFVGRDLSFEGWTSCRIADCRFLLTGYWSAALYSESGDDLAVTGSRFIGESDATDDSAIWWAGGGRVLFEDNWFEDRSGRYATRIFLRGEDLDFRRNVLLVRDPSARGVTLDFEGGAESAVMMGNDFINADLQVRAFWVQFEQNILVQGSAEGGGAGGGIVHCNDLWPDAGSVDLDGDYIVANNISADPLFCDEAGGDLQIRLGSPCAPANSPEGCGLIGAFDPACGGTPTREVSWGKLKQLFR